MSPRLHRFALLALFPVLLAACAPAGSSNEAAAAPSEPGLLQDPGFHRIEGRHAEPLWRLTQHAGPVSYTAKAEQGVVRIERVGGEPWGHFAQVLEDDGLAGQWLEFSAELRAELDDSYGEPMQPTGLAVLVRGRLPADPPMLGMRILHASDVDFDLQPGSHGWRRHVYRFQVPEAVSLQVKLAVQLTHGGWIEMRNPSLVAVDAPAE